MQATDSSEQLRREIDEKSVLVQGLWAKVEAGKRRLELKGATDSDLRQIESLYGEYEQSAKALEAVKNRYRAALEQKAGELSSLSLDTAQAADLLRSVKAAKGGDPEAHKDLQTKGWIEGTTTAGGFLVNPTILPGFLETRRATSPLRERCAQFGVDTDEIWLATKGNTVTVSHLAEGATKPDSTGTVGQKISTVFKVAGTSHVSDELLADSNGYVAQLLGKQFGEQVGIAVDQAIISGTGTGQPTGIRNTAGVTSTAVDGQTGGGLYESIKKASSRLRIKFYEPDTIVMHPRDMVKFDLFKDANGLYVFDGGLGERFPGVAVIADANVPTNLGAGTNEAVIIVGAFKLGAYFFQRQALTIEASRDAGWVTDETVFRAVERYGFAAVQPLAFELLTGITP